MVLIWNSCVTVLCSIFYITIPILLLCFSPLLYLFFLGILIFCLFFVFSLFLFRSCGLSLFIWSLWPFCLNYSWSARLERLKVLLVTTCLPWAATVLSTFSTGFTVTTLRDFSILLLLSQDVCRLYSTVTSSIFILQKVITKHCLKKLVLYCRFKWSVCL